MNHKRPIEVSCPTVYLFDIDGTLISSAGSARAALLAAFDEHLGDSSRIGFSFGMTDRAIIRQGLLASGAPDDDTTIDHLLEAYLARLHDVLAAAAKIRVQAGVLELLDALTVLESVALGLGTGNVERGARIKLGLVGLNDYFSFGGFGCVSELRPELIRVGAERGARLLGLEREACRVVVIGDTPKDVEAAHAIGAECIAVATGSVPMEVLRGTGAKYVFEDLAQVGVLEALLGV